MNRSGSGSTPRPSKGSTIERVTQPGPLFGANGIKVGPDGRLVVAEAFGSQVSSIDIETGACAVLVPRGGDLVAPDDVAFDAHGTLYMTEVMSARVAAREPDGTMRVIASDVPVANGITTHGDRIFMDEFRPGGRVMELYADGRAPRVIASDLELPNALAMGLDDHLYFPLVLAGEIGRVSVAGGPVERFFAGLERPTAVKFDGVGRLHVTQAGNGEIGRIDLQTRQYTAVAKLRPGIDNLAFSHNDRLFVSHFADGGICEIDRGRERAIVPPGFLGPFGVAVADDGRIFVADGMSLGEIHATGGVTQHARLLDETWCGFLRGVAVGSAGEVFISNTAGDLYRFLPGTRELRASGLGDAHGIAVAPNGSVLVADSEGGRVLRVETTGKIGVVARGLIRPLAVAVSATGAIYASESGRGRVVRVDQGLEVVMEGLREPHGVAISGRFVYTLDRAAKTLLRRQAGMAAIEVVAADLPVGEAEGISPKPIPGLPGLLPGPIRSFAGIGAAPDGSIYIAADGDGSVLRIRPA